MPAEFSPGFKAGLELQNLAAFGGVSHGLVQRRLRAINIMLARDPDSVFSFVPLTAAGTNGLRVTVSIRDDLWRNLALATNDFELIGHGAPRLGIRRS